MVVIESTVAVNFLVRLLINVIKKEYSLIQGLEGETKQLQKTLVMVEGYLNDVEKKPITQEAVGIWVRELEAVAFDADNVLDELSYHLIRKKLEKSTAKVLSYLYFNNMLRPRNMALKIKQINTDFESMTKRATELGLQNLVVFSSVAAAPDSSFETDSFALNTIFIGRDDDEPKLVETLTKSWKERMFSVLAIVGMGGMGKTTLTRKIFNNQKMRTQFGSLIWVHVSQAFDPITIFKKILSMLTLDAVDGCESREAILKRLQQALKAKPYLLVLDDVWNEDLPKWEDFLNSMSGVTSSKGNVIIMTTRNTKVASITRPQLTHTLNGLSDEECWSIIKAKAFENGDFPSGFEKIGRMIAKRCQGLPIAANVVGGVLRSKSEEEWRFINENWLSNGEGSENISKILKLSFDHLLSPSLKKCFAYCSIFPKGDQITKQDLIEQWMAEGFLEADERNDMEAVGDKFFNVLVHTSLLQVAERDDCGNVSSCVMHDLVHDLASSVLGFSTRYLIYKLRDQSFSIPTEVAKYLRTLFLEGESISDSMFSEFESLHVLTLRSNGLRELPSSIKKLIHLRNLDISKSRIESLPEWIGELHHLQKLRAERLRTLPSTLKYLINLRHLYIRDDVELPAKIGRLTCLQTLRHFTVGDNKGCRIEELGSLNNLKGKLKIRNLEKVHSKEEALEANLFYKGKLVDLHFCWDECREGETDDESVLEGLKPHPNLKKLGISGYRGKSFPSWDGPQGSWAPLHKLTSLSLSMCEECEEIPRLEHLPNLKNLCLVGLKKVRFISSSFTKLRQLSIEGLEGLECLPDWLFYNNQTLSKLKIMYCPRLRELPDGLHTLNSLEELTIRDCQNLTWIGGGRGQSLQGMVITSGLKIQIEGCGGLIELPRGMVESWAPSLESLELVELRSLKNLPMVMDCLTKSSQLKELRIAGVPKFMATATLCSSIESWPLGRLWKLEMDVSKEWSRKSSDGVKKCVDAILQGCSHSLAWLSLKGIEIWDWVPQSIQHLTALSRLDLVNLGVEELPEWFGNLSSLRQLSLFGCNKLRSMPSGHALDCLTELRELCIQRCPELRIDSEWCSTLHLHINVDGTRLQSCI